MIFPREPQHAADVGGHYDELDHAYRDIWGEHVHHGYWRTGRESAAEAVEALVDLVAERLELAPGLAACDIGCGYGATGEYLASRHAARVTGFTLSQAQARIGRLRKPAAGSFSCERRDWLDNGLAERSFDRAYAIESSEHMVDKQRFFDEAARVLRPGGRLVACVWLACERPGPWEIRHLLEPICREGRLPSMGSRSDYEAMARRAGFAPLSYLDISREVRRTWSICARRFLVRFPADPRLRKLVFGRGTKNRSFLLSLPRLILALRTGAMRYGVFAWEKPVG